MALFVCPISFAISAGVTEGVNVEKIEKAFDDAVEKMEKVRGEIKDIGKKTNSLVNEVKNNKAKMVEIRQKLDKTNRSGRFVLKRFKESYLNRFKESLYDLYEKCKKYLQSYKDL